MVALGAPLIAGLSVLLSGCSNGHEVFVEVTFQPGTTSAVATSVALGCGHDPTVWRIDRPSPAADDALSVGLWTHAASPSDPAIQAILECLDRIGVVVSASTSLLS